jgi:hypothetical protein
MPETQRYDCFADERADEAGDHHHRAERHRRIGARHPALALEERRHPESETAQRERVRRVAEDREEIGAVAEQVAIGIARARPRGLRRVHVLLSARRILHHQHEQREQQAGEAGQPEGRAPAEVLIGPAAEDVAGGRADRDGGEEKGEDAAAALDRKEIREDRRRDRAVSRLADADGRARDEERPEAPRESRETGGHAPDRDAEGDQRRPRAPVA